MPLDDNEYFYRRAETELKMAQASQNPAAVLAHYTLAGHYLDRAYGGREQQPASPEEVRARLPISPTMQ
ncbi:hypothetical protein FHY05_000035 [Sphingomonas sp. BK580]|nr:hypothetical protein [Sphingomonas sp. BK580]